MIYNLGTPSSKLQINFGELQIDTENSATGRYSKSVEIRARMSIKTHIIKTIDKKRLQRYGHV